MNRGRTIRILALAALLVLALLPARALAQQTAWVASDAARLRAGRSVDAAVVAELRRGAQVRVLKSEGAWCLVRTATGLEAWAYQGHLSPAPPLAEQAQLFAPLPGSIILAEEADSSRSARSTAPARTRDNAALWSVLELPRNPAALEEFLREGGIGEYARAAQQTRGNALRAPALQALPPGPGDTELQLGLNLAAAAARRVAQPVFGMQVQRYVNLVGLAVARFAPGRMQAFRFVVLDAPEPLSFSLPGGIVMVSTGLLAALNNEAQLALVLAHEAAHSSLGHVWARAAASAFFKGGGRITEQGVQSPLFGQMLDGVLEYVLKKGIDPRLEFDADQAALHMAQRAGYDPLQLAAAIQSVARAGQVQPDGRGGNRPWQALHPPVARRLARIQSALALLPVQNGLALATERYRHSR